MARNVWLGPTTGQLPEASRGAGSTVHLKEVPYHVEIDLLQVSQLLDQLWSDTDQAGLKAKPHQTRWMLLGLRDQPPMQRAQESLHSRDLPQSTLAMYLAMSRKSRNGERGSTKR